MSNMSRFIQGYEEDAANLCAAMTHVQAKSIDDLDQGQIRRMVWTARLWLRNQYDPQGLGEHLCLTEDARAEIMRRAMEAEQTADRRARDEG
jgi:hypothetical protein